MIISASRRTDIPSFYSDWFLNRIKEGYLYVRNPMNPHQISNINLSPDVVDCIVFWTKNPEPIIARLDELSAYQYYFQFTLTSYGIDIEKNLPHKKEIMIPTFQKLSNKIGKEKVIWRYDPILFTKSYTQEYHLKAFKQIACALNGYTNKCVISFVDIYAKNKKNMEQIKSKNITEDELLEFASKLYKIAQENNMTIASCAETIDLSQCGIKHNSCIDKDIIESIIGSKIKAGKDKGQRVECGCIESVEVGTYDTCLNGCKYCYANNNSENVLRNHKNYNPLSPLLCGTIDLGDKITERKIKSLKVNQEGQYMLICDYIVIQIDGDYAHLQRTDYAEEELKLVARALLPENITEGTKLHYEMMQYDIVE